MNLFVLKTWLQTKLAKDEQGANLVEYILLIALIALAVIAAVVFFRGQMVESFSEAGTKVSNAPNPRLTAIATATPAQIRHSRSLLPDVTR